MFILLSSCVRMINFFTIDDTMCWNLLTGKFHTHYKCSLTLACATRGYRFFSVCVFVDSYSGTTGYKVAYKRYKELQNYQCVITKCDFLEMTVISTGLPRPGLANSLQLHHCGMKLLKVCIRMCIRSGVALNATHWCSKPVLEREACCLVLDCMAWPDPSTISWTQA